MLENLSPNQILEFYGIFPAGHTTSRAIPTTILYRSATFLEQLYAKRQLAFFLLALAFGGIFSAAWPFIKLEINYLFKTTSDKVVANLPLINKEKPTPTSVQTHQLSFDPLVDTSGQPVVPVNQDFGLVIPSIGVNATVIPGVNPASSEGYLAALKEGVAHASTSYYPNENGTVYLFSHSTNYEWFVKDLNAIFYLLKNVKEGDLVVIMYLGNRYTYAIRETKVVSKREVSYLKPQAGSRNLILQTCWPPGTNSKRLLIFADLVEEKIYGDFEDEMFRPTQFGAINKLATLN